MCIAFVRLLCHHKCLAVLTQCKSLWQFHQLSLASYFLKIVVRKDIIPHQSELISSTNLLPHCLSSECLCNHYDKAEISEKLLSKQHCIPFMEAAILKWRQIFGKVRGSAKTPEDDSSSLDLKGNTHKRNLIKSLFPFQSVYFRETFERFQSSNDGH